MEFHKLANLFPMIQGAELEDLAADIKENGLLEKIWLHDDGSILDGRNRYRACKLVGVEPGYRAYTGDDPLRFVVSLNMRRRHLTESQRAMVAASIADMKQGDNRFSIDRQICPSTTNAQAADLLNVSERTVKSAKKVIEKGSQELQDAVNSGKASVSAASELAELPKSDQVEVVARGEKDILAAAKAIRADRATVRRAERIEKIAEKSAGNTPLAIGAKYPVILCDPPWRYEYAESDSRAIENQYPTMPVEDICGLPVGGIVNDDAVLFMWATSPKLAESLDVIKAWGFEYRTCAVWDKAVIGMGYYFRQQHELLLVATRGSLPAPAPANRPSSVILSRREAHSKKPDSVYEIIEAMYPELPKLEMFARLPRDGWVSWGNEVTE